MAWDVPVHTGQAVTLSLRAELREERSGPLPFAAPPRGHVARGVPEVIAGDLRLRQFVELSLADLECLKMVAAARPGDVFVAAGAPWYLTLFGSRLDLDSPDVVTPWDRPCFGDPAHAGPPAGPVV